MLRNRIFTISFVDISYSWGPAIHYLEVWNEYAALTDWEVVGYSVVEKNKKPYTKNEFPIRLLNLSGNTSSLRRWVAKMFFDFRIGFRLLFSKQSHVYVRASRFGVFFLSAVKFRKHRLYVELNGLAKEDQVFGTKKNSSRRVKFFEFMENLHCTVKDARVISVSKKISETAKERYGVTFPFTIYNGCASRLLRDTRTESLNSKDVLDIGFLGTFTPWDGHEKAGDLYRACLKAGRKVKMHIAGPKSTESVIHKEFQDNPDFVFYETIPYIELPEYYSKLDIGFSFGRFDRAKNVELSNLKLIEYWATRIPIIATEAKGNEFINELNIGYAMVEDEFNELDRFDKAVASFLSHLDDYLESYRTTRDPRTWKTCAEETREIIETS